MRVVVTGASGFIGNHLAQTLRASGAQVVALCRTRPAAPVDEWHALDVLSAEARSIAASTDAVVHLAGLSDASLSRQEPVRYNEVNALGTLNMLEGARQANAFFVLASSQRVYRPGSKPLPEGALLEPSEPYGYSKLIAEQWLEMYRRIYSLRGVVLRFFSVFGPGQTRPGGTSGVVSIFLHRALAGEELWVDGDRKADLTYVGDVARGIALAIEKRDKCGPVYNIATGEGTPLLVLANLVRELTGSRSPVAVREAGGARGDLVADIAKAGRDLGYAPVWPLRDGLARTLDWLHSERATST
ncbi:MAG: NAD-dependent epimerase/dehydratase family protein [Chloroflexota bacterium]